MREYGLFFSCRPFPFRDVFLATFRDRPACRSKRTPTGYSRHSPWKPACPDGCLFLTTCQLIPSFREQNEREKAVSGIADCRRKTRTGSGQRRFRIRFFRIRAGFSHPLSKTARFRAEKKFRSCGENTFFVRRKIRKSADSGGFFSRKRRNGLRKDRLFSLFGGKTSTESRCRFVRRNALRACVLFVRECGKPLSAVLFASGNPVPADTPSSGNGTGIAYFPRRSDPRANTRFPRGRN